jgi:hypothetical protein
MLAARCLLAHQHQCHSRSAALIPFAGRILKKGTLPDYNVQNGTIVLVQGRLCGGAYTNDEDKLRWQRQDRDKKKKELQAFEERKTLIGTVSPPQSS